MIKIQEAHIENFRGIRDLKINLNQENIVIHGPNGSGKSGVIDAIEFALTGDICRLNGAGTSGINIRTHAPHVDYRNKKPQAKVMLNFTNITTNNTFQLTRSVSAISNPTIEPMNDEANAILNYLSGHPEFSLSRREILKFIVASAGDRSKEVQSLLRIDVVNNFREKLVKLNTSTENEKKSKESAFNQEMTDLLQHFSLNELSQENILNTANEHRKLLGLDALEKLQLSVSLSSGLDSGSEPSKNLLDKNNFMEKVRRINNIAIPEALVDKLADLSRNLGLLLDNANLLNNINKLSFYNSSLTYIIDNICPLCETAYDMELLIQHVRKRIEECEQAKETDAEIKKSCQCLKEHYQSLLNDISFIIPKLMLLGMPENMPALEIKENDLSNYIKLLDSPYKKIESVLSLSTEPLATFNDEFYLIISSIINAIQKIPDNSSIEKSKHFLILANDKLEGYIRAKKSLEIWKKRAELTVNLKDMYVKLSQSALINLYNEVKNDFSRFYSTINREDEEDFTAQLNQTKSGLNLLVDFYGKGDFPPNAYHSEGHQDGMGVCLYLALVKKS